MQGYNLFLKSRFFRTFFCYILVFAFLAYFTLLFYTQKSYSKSENERLTQTVSGLDEYIAYTIDMANSMAVNEYVQQYTQSTDEYIDYFLARKIVPQLSAVSLSTNIFDNFAVVNLNNKNAISTSGTMSFSYLEQKLGYPADALYKQLTEMLTEDGETYTPYRLLRNVYANSIVACYCLDIGASAPSIFVVSFNLKALLANIGLGEVGGTTRICFSYDNSVLSFLPDGEVSFDDTDAAFSKKVAQQNYVSRCWGNITVTSLVPYIAYLCHINRFVPILLLVLFVVIGALYMITKNNVKQSYAPVRQLLTDIPDDIKNDSGDEFAIFSSYLNQTLNKENELLSMTKDYQRRLKDTFFLQLLCGTLADEEISQGIQTYDLDGIKSPLRAFIVTYRDLDCSAAHFADNEPNTLHAAIGDLFRKAFESAEFFYIFGFDRERFVGVVSDNFDDSAIEQKFRKVILSLESNLDISLIAFLGTKEDSLREAARSYVSANDLCLKCSIISSEKIVITEKTLNSVPGNVTDYPPELENALMKAVLAADEVAANGYVDTIIAKNVSEQTLTHNRHSQFAVMIYSTITKLLISIDKKEKDFFDGKSIYLELMSCRNSAELRKCISEFVGEIIAYIGESQKNTDKNMGVLIQKYIEENYMHDISLVTLSDYLNICQSYASKLFKTYIGENFKKYLTRVRLDKATEMMRANPGAKIGEIAEAVGYTADRFTRVFIKYYNMTPSNYQMRVIADEDFEDE